MKYPLLFLSLLVAFPATEARAQLWGSLSSVRFQHWVAQRNDFRFLRNTKEVREFIGASRLVELGSNADYAIKSSVTFPYARPAVKLFVERLAAEFHTATGEKLVITSLVRPINRQPRNASALSVHPAGMAVDIRIPAKAAHRRWLERTLLALEDKVVLDVTRERKPAHYHVAVFPREYERYIAELGK